MQKLRLLHHLGLWTQNRNYFFADLTKDTLSSPRFITNRYLRGTNAFMCLSRQQELATLMTGGATASRLGSFFVCIQELHAPRTNRDLPSGTHECHCIGSQAGAHPSKERFRRRMLGEALGEPFRALRGEHRARADLQGEELIVAALRGWKLAAEGTSSYLSRNDCDQLQ